MSLEMVTHLAQSGVWTVLIVAGPLLVVALALGLIVSIFQATTQIQEQTLAFIPKIAGVLLALVFFGPWMLSQLTEMAYSIYNNLYRFIG
ncbi:flagellar biosynthesis protein FliQ [Shouchella clausii]|jgi:flagellar biosynthesis protein FliQ|uniref:Flagellar biosynthetic protein FliQ n=3 Tax=Shouchella TaxID=2893057 RepID=Q3V823_SHOC1|nr:MULTISPECIES: flagellar biosynthesis protein FliQ [Shouchella]MCM3312181.1 flagellar biosynthesis protein FliQ [Psychrobacillus sp. MER TA 17]PAD44644.1 flagellar biosynthetic protein FliQ [Bacillus sp. 7520-S]SPU22186.1 flagellar biosynthesis protein FliQ [Niallia circulans]ALA54852.1 Flagellar biosynthesis protein FliQ [Shouchella clausii]AST97529.1 flagellar export apparatus protein FliQ [Shouchella clausii]